MTFHCTRSLRWTAPMAATLLVVLAGCAGRSLKEPTPIVDWSNGAQPAVSQLSPTAADQAVLYTVRRDDTLASIAGRFNTTPANLAAWNNLGPNPRVRPDQVLRIAPPGMVAPMDSSPVATTQPIGNGSIEQRSIDSPLSTSVLTPSTSVSPPSPSLSAPVKTGPLGIKRPYSDATLAELSRVDGDSAPVAPQQMPLPPTAAASVGATASAPGWAWPVTGKPAGPFDEKTKGIDIVGKSGDPVLAAADGKVTFSGTGVRGYGKLVIVQHSADLLSVYAHNRANLVEEGATVTKGQKIAEMGNTESDVVKLHFEIRRDSKPVDPLQYLPAR